MRPRTRMSIYALEQDGDAEELRRYLRGSDSPAVRERAATALGEVGKEHPDPATNALIRAAINDDEPRVRAAAVDAIDEIGGDALTRLLSVISGVTPEESGRLPAEALIRLLDHDMAELRMAAATAIGNQAATEAIPTVLEHLTDDDPRVRVRVIEVVGRVGDPRAVDPLMGLTEVAPAAVRESIARSLGGIGGPAALDALEPLLNDESPDVRAAAVIALGEFEVCRPIERLVERLADDEPTIKRAAITGIVDLISNAPAASSHDLRSTVIDSLSATHGDAVVTALIDLFEASSEARRRRNAVWLLGRVADSNAAVVGTLVDALDDDDETVRRFAATSLVAMGDPTVENALLDRLDSTVGAGRELLIFVLGKIGSERARERLLRLIDSVEEEAVQEQALGALSRLGGVRRAGDSAAMPSGGSGS